MRMAWPGDPRVLLLLFVAVDVALLVLARAAYRGSGAARVVLLLLVLLPLAQVAADAERDLRAVPFLVGLLVQTAILLSPSVSGVRRDAGAPAPVGQG